MFLLFEGFQAQNVLILFLFSMKYSHLLTILGYFNTTLEEYKVIYRDGTSDYITEGAFDGVQVILLKVKF